MGIFDVFKAKNKSNSNAERRAALLQKGRITDGTITDADVTEAGEEIVYFIYSIHGVDFESAEILSDEQKENPLQYAPGAKVGVRFDPKNHGNSILM